MINSSNNHSPHFSSIKKAAALKYDGKNTPKIVAKGDGELAQKIVSLAKENDVHIHYDPLLIDVLSRLELDEEIPETLFLAVAKIIAFAYYLQGKHPESTIKSKVNDTLTLVHSPAEDTNSIVQGSE
ncbi:MAG: flagellar biosynthesis protein FlhB [Gammaproteobacteria bacterium]|nr:MAG: flagellar biosynthesis protein FlhB [Gammaproteobacteria bacterium]